MSIHWMGLALASLIALPAMAADTGPAAPLDWTRARELHQRDRSGGTLTTEERAYLERARAERGEGGGKPGGRAGGGGAPGGGTGREGKASLGLNPLTDMGTGDTYKGQDGGLYGKGLNSPPPAQGAAALKAAGDILPRDADGTPVTGGKIGLVAVGMSNTTREFSEFMGHAKAEPALSPAVVLVDGAQGGMAGREWAGSFKRNGGTPWDVLDQRIRAAGLTSNQVQAAWIKQAEKNPGQLGSYPAHADVLASSLASIVQELKARYPQLRLVYLSSRIYAGHAGSSLNPEPYAYEGAFAVRKVIRRQIDGDPALDVAKAGMPVLLWGPYLWADGEAGRKADGLVYRREDFAADGTHPSPSGSAKVADLLLGFLKTDPSSRPWFVKPSP